MPTKKTDEHPAQPADHTAALTTDPSMDHPMDHPPAPLLKQHQTTPNQTKPNNNNQPQPIPTDAIQFYEQNVGIASPFVAESILQWTRDLPEELVIHAMERALEQGKPQWGYTKAILKSWHHKSIRTVEAARADAVQFRNHTQYAKQPRPTEVIPEWFRALEQQKEQPPAPDPAPIKNEQAALAEAQAMLDAITQKV